MTLPRDHEKSKRSWKRMSKRAKRPKRLPNFHRQHKFDERDIIIEIVDSTSYPSVRDKAARMGLRPFDSAPVSQRTQGQEARHNVGKSSRAEALNNFGTLGR
jgi:hypothetical protein